MQRDSPNERLPGSRFHPQAVGGKRSVGGLIQAFMPQPERHVTDPADRDGVEAQRQRSQRCGIIARVRIGCRDIGVAFPRVQLPRFKAGIHDDALPGRERNRRDQAERSGNEPDVVEPVHGHLLNRRRSR